MSNRTYPFYAGRTKYGGSRKCNCCAEFARHAITIQTSWFRGEDEEYLVCDSHSDLARSDYSAFVKQAEERTAYMRQMVDAQHEETGRLWKGERRALPPRYQEIPTQNEPV